MRRFAEQAEAGNSVVSALKEAVLRRPSRAVDGNLEAFRVGLVYVVVCDSVDDIVLRGRTAGLCALGRQPTDDVADTKLVAFRIDNTDWDGDVPGLLETGR